jgi:hypothetical protein
MAARSRSSATPSSFVIGHESVVKSGQEVNYAGLVTFVGAGGVSHQLRVRVRADSYVAQSWGRVERWDGAAWQEVWYVPGEALNVPQKLAYRTARPVAQDFAADVAALLQRAADVLAPPAVRS